MNEPTKTHRYLHASAAQTCWWVLPGVKRYADQGKSAPFDGVLVMGEHNWDTGSPLKVRERLDEARALGLLAIPGTCVFDGGAKFADWTDRRTWQWVAMFMLATTDPGQPFAIDFEPYWTREPRYPQWTSALIDAMKTALEPLAEVAKARGNLLWLIPGTRSTKIVGSGTIARSAYMAAAILNMMLPGQLVNGDESMYGIGKPETRPTQWKELLEAASGDSAAMKEGYVPGFYYTGLDDPELQTFVQSKGWDSWYYARPEELIEIGK